MKQSKITNNYDVIIIGVGASGLMAAVHAAKRGRKTLVVDHGAPAGRKMLISGGGKCNITNRWVSTTDYYGADTSFCKFALKHFPPEAVLQLLQKAKIETEEREHGRIFCKKGANEIVSYLVRSAKDSGVRFLMNAKVSEVSHSPYASCMRCDELAFKQSDSVSLSVKKSGIFCVKCEESTFEASHLLIATGGLAWPQIGATHFGYAIAKQFGHTVTPLRPALSGFILPPASPLLNLQGISLDVQIQIKGKNKIIEEPLLFTHRGISCPAALQVSCFWEKGDIVTINFLPSEDIISRMHDPDNGKLAVKSLVTQFLPERLVKALIPEQLSERKVAELSKHNRKIIAGYIHHYTVLPEAVEGFSKAEATLGGISTHELNPQSMESLRVKGLFFAGEVIDITGKLGGYNIHWAFASGSIAGQNM